MFMKLKKHKAREYRGKPLFVWEIVIPPKDIEKLGWHEGMELEGFVKRKEYCIFPKV